MIMIMIIIIMKKKREKNLKINVLLKVKYTIFLINSILMKLKTFH